MPFGPVRPLSGVTCWSCTIEIVFAPIRTLAGALIEAFAAVEVAIRQAAAGVPAILEAVSRRQEESGRLGSVDENNADQSAATDLGEVVQKCAKAVFVGSPNPDSSRFGPDEYCENDALPGSEFCAQHAEEES